MSSIARPLILLAFLVVLYWVLTGGRPAWTDCVDGYKVMTDVRGNTRQMIDEFGKGLKCDKK